MDKIAVLDFGGQYAHLIANRIRRLKVYSEVLPPETSMQKLRAYKGIILSGGPSSVYDKNAPDFDSQLLDSNIPILGICYGHHAIAQKLGGTVVSNPQGEYGRAKINVKTNNSIFKGLSKQQIVWMSHRDSVVNVPNDFEVLASTRDCENAAMGNFGKRIYGLQFHPEVTHTKEGMKILDNYIRLCECERNWNIEDRLPKLFEEIRESVGDKNVLTLVSGGVDSTVLYTLLNQALGPGRVQGVHIDTGFMRKNESRQVFESLSYLSPHLEVEDASPIFFEKLEKIYDPELKREIIGDLFISIIERKEQELGLDDEHWFIAQGTIYPDTIESGGTKHSAKIKSHHNRSPLALKLVNKGKIIEPLKEFYKDEVRELGQLLGLPQEIVMRHPFPGPGLAIRVLTPEESDLPKDVSILSENISKLSGLEAQVIPIRTVGVQGDERSYAHAVALYGKAHWNELEKVSSKITNEYRGVINRVVYCVSQDKSLEPLLMTPSYLTPQRVRIAQEADAIVTDVLFKNNLMEDISQMPVVLIPVGSSPGKESIVLRPVMTIDYMTADFIKMTQPSIDAIVQGIMKIENIDAVYYDITKKPPGTIEWE